MPFSFWRQRLRLMRGHELIVEGMQVQGAAWTVGYENVSSFIAKLKRCSVQPQPRWVEYNVI
ncbi:hypothetical protein DPQ33_09645 [Oceanidesulfovibrio indonesiensis]|uniref:HTH araC/xylS-type domain-containing protein n=1 Tax=Oceanidesulfovibrio indonesiensis TaxID=54767 RepID=A0A7M3ME33_9BACT|nr:hypothetical protein DPQ33_09645 [Oceanidesulfovibrio indonesiensis]